MRYILKRLILLLLLGCLTPLAQAQVNTIKYKTVTGDGFDASRSEAFVWEIFQPETVCVGEDALFTMQIEGSLLYSYRWYKVGEKSKTLSTESFLWIRNCQAGWNNWKYLCEVTDLNTGEVFEPEDTFRLNIKVKPEAKWINTKVDTTICAGQKVNLRVGAGEPGEYVYTWFGEGISGDTYRDRVTVQPDADTRYRVSISNGYCVSDTIGMRVRVKHSEVRLPQDIMYAVDGQVKLTPSVGEGGTLEWTVAGNTYTGAELDWSMPSDMEETTVKVTRTVGKCVVSDSMVILNETAMRRFVGGIQDGFVESMQKISVSGITPILSEVCLGDNAYFICNVGTIGTFTYQWYKIGTDGNGFPLSGCDNSLLVLENTAEADTGRYYCVVFDLDTKQSITTAPATLRVIQRPELAIPMDDTTICLGEQIVLTADREAEEGEIFRWNGLNIQTNPTKKEITVAPDETAVYQLVAMKGACMTSREITVRVMDVQVHTQEVVDVLLGDTLRMSQPAEPQARYHWTSADGNNSLTNTFAFTPDNNTVVYVEKRIGRCKAQDSTLVYVKEYGVGQTPSSVQDGYAESILPFRILSLDCPKRLCMGDEAILNVEVQGYDVYQYTWKKRLPDDSEVVIDTVKQHIISSVGQSDAGVYFCEVKDVRSGKVLVSDETTMEVLQRPIAGINILDPGFGAVSSCWVCAGTMLTFEADRMDGLTYLWEGVGLLGATDQPTITALPEETTDFSLVVSNGVCSDMTFLQVNVWDISVDIPEVKIVGEGEAFVVEPLTEIPDGGKLAWQYDNGTRVEADRFTSTGISKSGYLKVELTLGECQVRDSMRIYVRGYNTFFGGEEDGFAESNSSFMIQELHYSDVVCENSDADFSIRVKGSGVYAYNWRQVGLATSLSTESTYTLNRCTMDMAGQQYYCLVTDLMLGKTLSSDTITLNMRKGPQAVIGYPERGKAYCVGTKIRLDARKTEDYKESPDIEYVYSWEGERVTPTESPFAVEVQPSETQIYTLKVSSDICSAYDTILIKVIDPRVDIPSVIYADEGQPLTIRATVSNASVDATINWWHNALFTPSQNPFIINNILESANVVAEVEDRGCKFSDTARVYVRTARFFAGGDDDGFMESCNIPEINPDVTTVLGCGGVDSVEMNVVYSGDPKTFVWQRYDKDAGRFTDVADASELFGLGTPSLKIKPLLPEYYGQYRCVLTNDCGSTYSLTYKVSNGNPPQVAIHEDTLSVCEGVKDYRMVMVLKEDETVGELTYRWYKKNPITGVTMQFTPEASFNKKEYLIPEVTPEYDALYLMEAEGVCGIAKDSVRLIVDKKVSFRIQPRDTVVCYNTNVTLHAYSQDGGICSYTLKKVVPDKGSFEGYRVEKLFKKSAVNRYDFRPALMEDDGYYVWTVSSICGDSITSRMFKMTVEKPVQFIAQTPDTAVCLGSVLTLNVKAESPDCPNSAITYEWYKLSDGKLAYTTPVINLTVGGTTGGTYLCSATNVCGKVELAKPIEVTIHPELVITQNPVWSESGAGICEEKLLELNFAVNRTDIVDSIRWYRRNGGTTVPIYDEGTRIVGTDDYALHVDSIRLNEEGMYYARVYNVCGVYETFAVDVKVDEKAKIVHPIEYYFDRTVVCKDEELDLQVEAAGKATLIYTWEKNGQIISGAESNVLRVIFDENATYRCSVHNYCDVASSEWSVSVVQPDTFRFKALDATHYCEGGKGVRLFLVGSDPECTYTLYRKANPTATPENVLQVKAKEHAAFDGGSLDFGLQTAGHYYVMAFDPDLNCEGKMPGEVEVVMDSLPKIFNVEIGYPICEGNLTGTVLLDSSQYGLGNRYQYSLEKQESTGWQLCSAVVAGTDSVLTWNNVMAGIYRITAVDRQTGCSAVMNNVVDLSEHPNPEACELLQYQGDTLYCEGQKIEIGLRMNQICFTLGQTYTLMKDGVLTKEVRTDNTGWTEKTPGAYAVVVKNDWGCADTTRTIRVHQYPLPTRKKVGQDRFYCEGDVPDGSTALITIDSVDANIQYAFYRKGENTALETGYKKPASVFLSAEVPLSEADYYVVATDTATGCSVPMKDTVKIQSSRMELSHTPVSINRSDNSVRLNLTVKNAVGKVKVTWEPEDQIQDLTDPMRPWVNMMDLSKNTFTATVSDTACTKTERIVVTLEGQALTAAIKEPVTGADIPNDTLWVCEGSTYSLDGEVLGGKEPFAYDWSVDGTTISNKQKLTNAVATKSGNLVFRVSSNGRIAKDSIRLELYPAPGRDLRVNIPDVCVAIGDVFEMNLSGTQPGVTYTLEYGKNKDVIRPTTVSVVGDLTGQATLSETFTEDKAGYYRVQASYQYGSKTCTSVHDTVKVGVGVYNSNFFGGGDYCYRTGLDSLVVDTTVMNADYWLLYKATEGNPYLKYDLAGVAAGNNDSLFFVGNWPTGYYRVAAKKKGSTCVDTLPGEAVINHLDRPKPGTLVSDKMEYCIQPGNDLKVTISLSGAEAGNTYRLYRQNGSSVELLDSKIVSQNGDFTYGTDYQERGRYFSVADNGSCLDTAGYVLIGQLPEGPIELVKTDTGYCASTDKDDIRLKLYPLGSDVRYYIYAVGNTWSHVAECTQFTDDTVSFKGYLSKGDYIIKAQLAECNKEIASFRIAEYPLPNVVDILSPTTVCEGTTLDMGVKNSEAGMLYEIIYDKDGKHTTRKAGAFGNGGDLHLWASDTAGSYYVQARDTLTGCVQSMDSYAILKMPKSFDFIATDTVFCAFDENSGTQLALSGTEANVVYVLQQYDTTEHQYVDVYPEVKLTGTGMGVTTYFSGFYGVGKYRVRTTTCTGSFVGEELEIRKLELPADTLLVDLKGNGCVDSTMSIAVKASENGVKYTLWQGNTQVLTALTGDGSDLSWTVNQAVKGTYEIHALREGATRDECASVLKRKIDVESLPLLRPLQGTSPICRYTTTALEIAVHDESATYTLHRKADSVKVVDGKVGSVKVTFDGVAPGAYYAMAAHGDCKIKTPVFTIDSIQVPDITDVQVDYTDCIEQNGGRITVNDLQDTLNYVLVYPGGKEETFTKLISTSKSFDKLEIGMYGLKVQDKTTKCYSLTDTLNLNWAVPAGDTLVGPFGYCEGKMGAKVKLGHSTLNVKYLIKSVEGDTIEWIYGGIGKTFQKYYKANDDGTKKEYIFVAERQNPYGGCLIEKSFWIEEYATPDLSETLKLNETGALCAGTEYHISVEDAQANMAYVLYFGKTPVDTVYSDAPDFKGVSAAGDYTVVPKTGGMCGTKALDTLFRIQSLPEKIFVEQPCSYCQPADMTKEKGAALKVYNTENKVQYVLRDDTDTSLDTIIGDISLALQEFDVLPAGEYMITATSPQTGCSDVVGTGKIEKLAEPKRFVCGVDGQRCAMTAPVEINDSETDVKYYLYRGGKKVDGPMDGADGTPISFGEQTEPGIYQILAESKAGCTVYMKDSVLVYPLLTLDTLVVKGSYCEQQESDISLRLRKQSVMWNYFVQRAEDGASSDTLAGAENTILLWSEIGGKDIRGGKYRLYAMNPCGDLLLMDSVVIDTNRLPEKYDIVGGDMTVCMGDSAAITLSSSQAEVEYDLMYRSEVGAERLLLTKSGSGAALELAKVDGAGTYTVIGRMKATKCTDTVATVKVKLIEGLQSPRISASDVCLTGDPGQSLEVQLGIRQNDVSYYLQRIHEQDTVLVDSIRWGVFEDAAKKVFLPQTDEGIYRVVAKGPSCRKEFPAARIGNGADNQDFTLSGEATICGGDAREIGLANTQLGVQYEVYRIQRYGYQPADSITTNVVGEGTGSALKLGDLTQSGLYMVKAYNGCSVWMSDTLRLNVNEAYKIKLRESYTICGADDSVRIEILGRTNPAANAQYLIFEPGESTFSEIIVSGNMEASVQSAKWYRKSGFYRVQGIDATGCPEMDSVEIKVLALPNVYPFVLRGNKFLCDNTTRKELVVEGAQRGVDYHLYRVVSGGTPEEVTMISAGASDMEIKFTVYQEGTYYVVGQYNDKGQKSCPVRMDGEVELTPVEMHKYALESVRDAYCSDNSGNAKGELKLLNSDVNIAYQLYQDGVAYGDSKQTSTPGAVLTWDNLPGGLPKMSETAEAKPVKYTVKATDLTTGCEVDMNGTVNVIAERTILFNEKQLQDVIPTCLGERLNMLVLAYGGKIAYQWKKGSTELTNGKQYYYTKDTVKTTDIGVYHCEMTNTCGTVRTSDVEVVPALLIDRPSKGVDTTVVCNLKPTEVRSVLISSRSTNADAWEWYKNGTLLKDEIFHALDLAVSRGNGAGVYTCKASNSCGFIWDTCVVIVDSTPRIELVSPVHRDTVCVGSSWELEVKSDYPVAWMRGNQLTAYTGNTMKIDPLQMSDRGTYFVTATNQCGEVKEEVALLVVDSLIDVISKQSQFHICRQSGELPHLYILTNPRDRVYYRWEDLDGNVLGSGNELNSIDLTKYNHLIDTFRVYYGNKCQDSYKDITLVTSDFIQFKQPVEEVGACVADALPDTVLRVVVMNEQEVTYKWYRSVWNKANMVRDSVGNADTLQISLKRTTGAGYYYCYIANRCVDTVSRMVNVRIDTIPEVLLKLPKRDTLCSGSEMQLKVAGRAGAGSLKYTWYVKKKYGTATVVASEQYFGSSQSEYKCYVDTSYNGALVWCDLSTYCQTPSTDTLHLTVLPALKVDMSTLAALNCEGQDNQIFVKLEQGSKPWKYKYSVDGVENATIRSVTGETDTLKVSTPGIYRVSWLADAQCVMNGKELASTEFSVLKRSKFTFEALNYTGSLCPDSEVTLRIKITGGVPGPWNIGIYRESDGELASELGFTAVWYTTDSIYTCTFNIQKDEKYFAKVTNIYATQECEAEALVKSVELKVMPKPDITMNDLKPEDRIVGACNNVSLGKLFNVQPSTGGWYVVNNQQLSGDWLLNPEQSQYTVGYRIYKDGCVFNDYNLGDIEFKAAPKLKADVLDNHVLCGSSDQALASFQVEGEAPVKVTYQIFDLYKDGKMSLVSTVNELLPTSDIRFYYDENLAGKVIKMLRLEDKYKCLMADTLLVQDTVFFSGYAEYEVYTKERDSVLWKLSKDAKYRIRRGDVVDMRVKLTKGQTPWSLTVMQPLDYTKNFTVDDIPTLTVDSALRESGFYEINVTDKHCPTDMFADKSYVTISVIDTAYVTLKAYLEGPWDEAKGLMVSSVLDKIDKRGLSKWPNVGSRKIIDWVMVELWKDDTDPELWDSQWALLLDDGSIVDTDGNAQLKVMGKTSAAQFRIAIRSRNHLATWSKAYDLSATTKAVPCVIDFTKMGTFYLEPGESDVSKYAGMDNKGRMLLYGGEVNANRLVTSFDPNRITREVLSLTKLDGVGNLLLDVNYNGKVEWPGYNTDVSGSAEFLDWSIMYKNRSKYSIVPDRKISW